MGLITIGIPGVSWLRTLEGVRIAYPSTMALWDSVRLVPRYLPQPVQDQEELGAPLEDGVQTEKKGAWARVIEVAAGGGRSRFGCLDLTPQDGASVAAVPARARDAREQLCGGVPSSQGRACTVPTPPVAATIPAG
jgi:hypothetical protein